MKITLKKLFLIFSIFLSVEIHAQSDFLQPFTPSVTVRARVTGDVLGKAGYSIPAGENFWSLFQWGNPANIYPQTFPYGQGWQIGTGYKRVQFYPVDNGRTNVYELSAANLPCASSVPTDSDEVDMFLSPEGLNFPQIALGSMGQLNLQIGTEGAFADVSNTCPFNHSAYVASIILTTTSSAPSSQVIFLQIVVGATEYEPVGMQWCPFNPQAPNGFCLDDSISNYGGVYIGKNGSAKNNVDILPRIFQIIRSGYSQAGIVINNDPNQWRLGGVYIGTVNYGGVNVSVKWWDPKLRSSGGTFCDSGGKKVQYICEAPPPSSAGTWGAAGNGCYHRATPASC